MFTASFIEIMLLGSLPPVHKSLKFTFICVFVTALTFLLMVHTPLHEKENRRLFHIPQNGIPILPSSYLFTAGNHNDTLLPKLCFNFVPKHTEDLQLMLGTETCWHIEVDLKGLPWDDSNTIQATKDELDIHINHEHTRVIFIGAGKHANFAALLLEAYQQEFKSSFDGAILAIYPLLTLGVPDADAKNFTVSIERVQTQLQDHLYSLVCTAPSEDHRADLESEALRHNGKLCRSIVGEAYCIDVAGSICMINGRNPSQPFTSVSVSSWYDGLREHFQSETMRYTTTATEAKRIAIMNEGCAVCDCVANRF